MTNHSLRNLLVACRDQCRVDVAHVVLQEIAARNEKVSKYLRPILVQLQVPMELMEQLLNGK
jgi:hypothetical protein